MPHRAMEVSRVCGASVMQVGRQSNSTHSRKPHLAYHQSTQLDLDLELAATRSRYCSGPQGTFSFSIKLRNDRDLQFFSRAVAVKLHHGVQVQVFIYN